MARKATGRFIVIEGTDGSGITTQAQGLVSWLAARDLPAHYTKEPSTGPFGVLLRQVLTGDLRRPRPQGAAEPLDEATLALAFAADRLDHLATDIEPALAGGAIVVCDRYLLSSLAYQGRLLDRAWLLAINTRCRTPDLTIFLDVPPEVSMARIVAAGRIRERYEQVQTLADVRASFHEGIVILQQSGQRITIVDATQPLEAVATTVRAAVDDLLAAGH